MFQITVVDGVLLFCSSFSVSRFFSHLAVRTCALFPHMTAVQHQSALSRYPVGLGFAGWLLSNQNQINKWSFCRVGYWAATGTFTCTVRLLLKCPSIFTHPQQAILNKQTTAWTLNNFPSLVLASWWVMKWLKSSLSFCTPAKSSCETRYVRKS